MTLYQGEILREIENELRNREIGKIRDKIKKMNDRELSEFHRLVKEERNKFDKVIWK